MTSAPVRLPPHAPGMRIGLFGGSFDPPHEGHALVSRVALTRFGSIGCGGSSRPAIRSRTRANCRRLTARIAAAKKILRDPRVAFTGFEAEIGARYTCDTLEFLHAHCPGVRFVWIMGADNLLQFHRWRRWKDIARTTPIAVIDRPGATLKAANAKAAVYFKSARVPESEAGMLAVTPPPAIVYLHGPRIERSSTELRAEAR